MSDVVDLWSPVFLTDQFYQRARVLGRSPSPIIQVSPLTIPFSQLSTLNSKVMDLAVFQSCVILYTGEHIPADTLFAGAGVFILYIFCRSTKCMHWSTCALLTNVLGTGGPVPYSSPPLPVDRPPRLSYSPKRLADYRGDGGGGRGVWMFGGQIGPGIEWRRKTH
jgi:hypothetical protein